MRTEEPQMKTKTQNVQDPPIEDLPAVLTVEEAAAVLRIGRGAAYELARRYRFTGGREGLPVIELGRSLRVPRHALMRMLDIDEAAAANGRNSSSDDV